MDLSAGGQVPLWRLQAVSALLDAVGRLALPLAVLGLSRGAIEPAVTASIVATFASIARSWVGARATELAFVESWRSAVLAARRRPPEWLSRRREDEESVSLLMQGVWDQASFRAVVAPQAVGLMLAFVGIVLSSFAVLGIGLTMSGGALLGAFGAATLLLARGLRRSQERTWTAFGELAVAMRVLLEGALELRAAGREAHVASRVTDVARRVAMHQAQATASGMRMGLVPASLAVLAVLAPIYAGVDFARAAFGGPRLIDASVLGFAALAIASAAAKTWETWTSSLPQRRRFQAFARDQRRHTNEVAHRTLPLPLSEAPIVFRGFSHEWAGDGVATPKRLDLELAAPAGVALVGPNGTGKTTALLAVLGAIRPTRGRVEIADTPAHEVDPSALAGRIGYVPQDPLVLPGESLAWHFRLYEDATDDHIDAAVEAVGLTAVLAPRARARGVPIRELPAGELSGGERRKLALARALQAPRALYVLDEPEAGLDASSRRLLRRILVDLAQRARVIVVAHDRSAVPPSYRVVLLEREASR